MAMQSLGMIILILAVLLVVGVPISYSIGIASLFTILQTVPLDISVVTGAQRIFVGMSKFSLTAIPFFILAGNLMNQGGIAKRLVNFVMAILGKLPGALLVTNVGANALFGAISGSASAAAAAVGSMVLEGEQEQGYDEALCAATNGASAPSGLLIPPSNALITYSLAAGGTSVAALFMAGYLPGVIWAVCCMVVAIIIARKKGYKGTPGKFSWAELGKATLQAIPSLSLIIVVIGGIIAGVFSATEGSAIAVVYALILGICYRNITWKSFPADPPGGVRRPAGHHRQPHHHPAHHERDPAGGRHLHGRHPGHPDLHPAVPAHRPDLWDGPHPLRPGAGVQPVHRQHHPAGGQHPVRGHQGGPHHPGQDHAVHAGLLCGHPGGPDAGDLRPGDQYVPAADGGPGIRRLETAAFGTKTADGSKKAAQCSGCAAFLCRCSA